MNVLYSKTPPEHKRIALRNEIDTTSVTVLPGAFNSLTAQMIARERFPGVYISGHMIAADLGLPDIGLTTLTEVATRGEQLSRLIDIPAIIDADTGFGGLVNVARTIQTLEEAGLAGCHIEDQINPKQCGHSIGVDVVDAGTATQRIRAAVSARRDSNFLIIARTDARAVHGLREALDRAKSFIDAGADVIFPEALLTEREYESFRNEINVPLMINLNEFGRETPLTLQQVENLGYNIAIYPMTLMRLAHGAVSEGLRAMKSDGHQLDLMPTMQSKDELYDLLGYDDYSSFDDSIFTSSS